MPHGFKPTHVLVLILLLIPSAAFLWHNSDLPQFGDIHDDSVYYVSAKSLATGSYRIESLPTQPYQTKYPPLYPLLLSIAWRMNPQFPQNLPIAAWLSWLALPVMLAVLAALYPRMGFDGWRKWLLLTALAVNSYVIAFGAKLLSELWFTALLVAALLLTEKAAEAQSRIPWAVAAGLMGGLTYLSRSAGIVLLASGFIYLWMRQQRNKAMAFAGAMLPFVVAWMLWVRLHQLHTNDQALIYYTDYFGQAMYNLSLKTTHLFLWKNLDGVVSGLGYIVLPNVTSSLFMKILADVLGVAMISGTVRMFRAGQARHYIIFAAGTVLLLLAWDYPPNERYVLPLVPLAFAGLLTEMEHFAGMARAGLKHRDASQRVAAAMMIGLVALVFTGAIALQAYVAAVAMGETAQQQRVKNIDLRGAYAWIRANLPADAALVSYNDPLLYLYTGRRSINLPIPPFIWYTEDHARAVDLYAGVAPYALEHGAGYFYHTTADFSRDMSEDDAAPLQEVIRTNPALTVIYQKGIGTIYRVSCGGAGPAEDREYYGAQSHDDQSRPSGRGTVGEQHDQDNARDRNVGGGKQRIPYHAIGAFGVRPLERRRKMAAIVRM